MGEPPLLAGACHATNAPRLPDGKAPGWRGGLGAVPGRTSDRIREVAEPEVFGEPHRPVRPGRDANGIDAADADVVKLGDRPRRR